MKVRREKVEAALKWLVVNNRIFRKYKIEINQEHLNVYNDNPNILGMLSDEQQMSDPSFEIPR